MSSLIRSRQFFNVTIALSFAARRKRRARTESMTRLPKTLDIWQTAADGNLATLGFRS